MGVTQNEFLSTSMLGPYYSLVQLPDGDPILLNTFGILEMHGGATEESCRVIDDGRSRGHNADSANTAACRPADLDLLAAVCRIIAETFPGEPLSGYPSDLKSAYRQVLSDPNQALDFVIASWDTDRMQQAFFLAVVPGVWQWQCAPKTLPIMLASVASQLWSCLQLLPHIAWMALLYLSLCIL